MNHNKQPKGWRHRAGNSAAGWALALVLVAGPSYGARLFVDAGAQGNESGTTWENAFTDLQPALSSASSGDEIWVACATYLPGELLDLSDPRSATFNITSGVSIFGGFAGGEVLLSQRNPDPQSNGCVLDETPSPDAGFDRFYHIMHIDNVSDPVLIDGFAVVGGPSECRVCSLPHWRTAIPRWHPGGGPCRERPTTVSLRRSHLSKASSRADRFVFANERAGFGHTRRPPERDRTVTWTDDPFACLHAEAQQALTQAYAPYSRLRVGAAIWTARGGMYSGCNVENGAFPVGGCAEHHAIAAAVRAEGPDLRIRAVAVAALDADGRSVPIPPCGACRQLIREFGAEAEVSFLTAAGDVRRFFIGELLPESFNSP